MNLHIDIETYSSVDITTAGAYVYTQSPDFEILLVAYAIDNEPIKIIDIAQGEKLTKDFLKALNDPTIKKWAHNAIFERIAFKSFGYDIPIKQWYCTAIKSAYCGYPLSLANVSAAMNLGDKGKLSIGKNLIKYFCVPCKPSKVNNMRLRNYPKQDVQKWELFKKYCINDVEAEREIYNRLAKFNIPDFERKNYILDQEINDRGVLIDINFVKNALNIDNIFRANILEEVKNITGLNNVNSVKQLCAWLNDNSELEVEGLTKQSVKDLLEINSDIKISKVLEGRQKLAKTSTKKYASMIACAGEDSRARGLFQFYGATHTGRWAGRLIQLQNLPKNHMLGLDLARKVVNNNDYELISMLYDNISNVLSELIRTALIAPQGYTFSVADFSAIEARVLAWLANETWRLEVFNTHGKIYEASAAMMFNVPIESVTKGSELRQRGKVAELALGYQGSVGAIEKMDIDNKIPANERKSIVTKWRKANSKIVQFWEDLEETAKNCILNKKEYTMNYLTFRNTDDTLQIILPSGRALSYLAAHIGINRFGNKSIIFSGMEQTTRTWGYIETYGGKLTENIVQAISRDLLAYAMQNLRIADFKIVAHIHDEVISETKDNKLKQMCELMCETPPWAPGLPLKAEGYTTAYYKKD